MIIRLGVWSSDHPEQVSGLLLQSVSDADPGISPRHARDVNRSQPVLAHETTQSRLRKHPVQDCSLAPSAGYYLPQFQVLAIPVDFIAECGHQGCDRTKCCKECTREKSWTTCTFSPGPPFRQRQHRFLSDTSIVILPVAVISGKRSESSCPGRSRCIDNL